MDPSWRIRDGEEEEGEEEEAERESAPLLVSRPSSAESNVASGNATAAPSWVIGCGEVAPIVVELDESTSECSSKPWLSGVLMINVCGRVFFHL